MHTDSVVRSVIWASMSGLNSWRRAEYLIHFVHDPRGASVIPMRAKSAGDAHLAEDVRPEHHAAEQLQIGTLQTTRDQALSWVLTVLEEAATLVADGSIALHYEVAQVRAQHGCFSIGPSRMGLPKRTQHNDLNDPLRSIGRRSRLPAEDNIHKSAISDPVVRLVEILEMMLLGLVVSIIYDFDTACVFLRR